MIKNRFKITENFKSAEKDRKLSYLNKLARLINSDLNDGASGRLQSQTDAYGFRVTASELPKPETIRSTI